MVKKIKLNDTVIPIENYEERIVEGLHNIIIDFKVKSEDYHDIAVLLYEGTFNVVIPEKDLMFKGSIQQYSTSITNLYEEGQIGDYHVSLLEVKN
ncbi:DUF3219 family protein [Ureibacillus sinduriensis]|uniref:DUF3219 domain-containing protein n=1 Tax=Ureibacillus sinduriensis BLB-1 = JCM 15800 TaxID=1384057 RepID=A0A0A3HQH5_9BACL|nr:DUF3219 family protein [Ureibacillus sinduriensis]KGR74801.1 hypothetical protein CD33_13560 [Ureibacillus sinduriensis BLB-1 = JCM 15800]